MGKAAARTSVVVHQTVHGYGHGHELLASSTVLDDEVANRLSHNSDAAPNVRRADGDYLTGYPLSDGSYVVARTWHQLDAERPNTVLTRSLILPTDGKSGFSAARILDVLERPIQSQLDGGLSSLEADDLAGPPLRLAIDEAVAAERFYDGGHELRHDDPMARQRIALAIWAQLWRSARYSLYFCTAPGTDRFAQQHRSLRFEPVEFSSSPPEVTEPASSTIVRDLAEPGGFREFAHFVGSGERAIGLMKPFARAYGVLNSEGPSVTDFADLLGEVRGTDPKRLRRLKRRFLSFDRDRPRWRVEPFDTLHALAVDELGTFVFASDASLEGWLSLCWKLDPHRTADLLRTSNDFGVAPSSPPTAREGVTGAFTSKASELIGPSTLSIAAEFNREAALAAVWERNDPDLWRAWARADDPLPLPKSVGPSGAYDWHIPLAAVRERPDVVSLIVGEHPDALGQLVELVDSAPAPSDLAIKLDPAANRYLRDRLGEADTQLVGLARLSDAGTLPRSLKVAAWRNLLLEGTDEATLATAFLVSKRAGASAWEVTALAAAELYRVLAADVANEAWSRLSPNIRGDRHTWDRCGRLIDEFAHVLGGYPAKTKTDALVALRKRNPAAGRALGAHLREDAGRSKKKRKFRLLDPSTW